MAHDSGVEGKTARVVTVDCSRMRAVEREYVDIPESAVSEVMERFKTIRTADDFAAFVASVSASCSKP